MQVDNTIMSASIEGEMKGIKTQLLRDFESPSLVETCVGQQPLSATKHDEPETYFEYSNEEEIQIRETEHKHLLQTGHFN